MAPCASIGSNRRAEFAGFAGSKLGLSFRYVTLKAFFKVGVTSTSIYGIVYKIS